MVRFTHRKSLVVGLAVCLLLWSAIADAVVVTRVTVATAQTLVYTSPVGGANVLIRNPGSASVYLGATGVLTSTGFELAAGDAVTLPLGANDALYGIVASATVVVHVMESRR